MSRQTNVTVKVKGNYFIHIATSSPVSRDVNNTSTQTDVMQVYLW